MGVLIVVFIEIVVFSGVIFMVLKLNINLGNDGRLKEKYCLKKFVFKYRGLEWEEFFICEGGGRSDFWGNKWCFLLLFLCGWLVEMIKI